MITEASKLAQASLALMYCLHSSHLSLAPTGGCVARKMLQTPGMPRKVTQQVAVMPAAVLVVPKQDAALVLACAPYVFQRCPECAPGRNTGTVGPGSFSCLHATTARRHDTSQATTLPHVSEQAAQGGPADPQVVLATVTGRGPAGRCRDTAPWNGSE